MFFPWRVFSPIFIRHCLPYPFLKKEPIAKSTLASAFLLTLWMYDAANETLVNLANWAKRSFYHPNFRLKRWSYVPSICCKVTRPSVLSSRFKSLVSLYHFRLHLPYYSTSFLLVDYERTNLSRIIFLKSKFRIYYWNNFAEICPPRGL
jgi:hypothetical protein